MRFKELLLILGITQVNNGCAKQEPCPKPEPKIFTTCINGAQMWQTIEGERGLMIRLDGFKPIACK